ncbi:MAG: GspH/FimT family pseudopilin [Rhodoferax sp.]
MPYSNKRGFTLIEMLITISILAVLMGVVSPSISEWIANVKLRATAEAVMVGLQKTRAEAIKQNRTVTFWMVSPSTATALDATCALASSSASWVISGNNPEGLCDAAISTPPVPPYIVEAHGAGSSAQGNTIAALDANGGAASSIGFDGFGQISNPGGAIRTIDFTSPTTGTRRIRVQIASGGSVRMCDRDVAVPDPRTC